MVRFMRRGPSHEKREKMLEASGEQEQSVVLNGGEGPEAKQKFVPKTSSMDKNTPKSRFSKEAGQPSDMELMKERFAKLLLGEDMSGGGKGVSSALALSNAITNLSASVFGEQYRLEPMSAERKARWRKEVDWLLSVTDHIVEFVASQQTSENGTTIEVMTTQQRRDLHMNIPALRKLDAMLIGYLDNFKDQNEFWYVKRDADDSEKGVSRKEEKWWLPTVKVPQSGLSEVSRRWIQFQKESVNQVLKAAMAINAQVIMEMQVPDIYIESLPKNGKESLGDAIYRSMADDNFDPEEFLEAMDLSTDDEHKILDLKNRIEASIVIWRRKMINKENRSWSSSVSIEKREQLEERAETLLHLLKLRFPGIPQSALDISKIQYNKDVGQAVLESYSRVLESLAFTVLSRIEDVIYADMIAQDPSLKDSSRKKSYSEPSTGAKKLDPKEEMEKLNEANTAMTLSDFMGWHFDPDSEGEKKANIEEMLTTHPTLMRKPLNLAAIRKFSYLESLGALRSPTSRH